MHSTRPPSSENQPREIDVMKDLLIGDRLELFSPSEFEVVLEEHDFYDSQAAFDRLTDLYSYFILYSEAEPPMTSKQIKAQLSSVSKNAKRLKKSLDLPLWEGANLHARSGIDRHELEATLIRLADEAGKLISELKKEAAGRRSPIKNQFVLELAQFYEEYTGHKASSYTHRPDNVAEEQYQGKGLSFIRCCMEKANIWSTDEAIVQVIRRMEKSRGGN